MLIKNTSERYGAVAIILHWIIAVLIIGLILLGWYMTTIDYYHKWYHTCFFLHKAFGILVIKLVVVDIFWLAINKTPNLPTHMKAYEVIAAKITHVLLIMMMILMPITGYFISTAAGDGIDFFNLYTFPNLLAGSHEYGEIAGKLHEYLGYFTAGLIVLHVLAALKHQFINKDNLLRRMLGF